MLQDKLFISMVYPMQASRMDIPILVDAEKKRPWFDDILELANYAVCAAKFPQVNLYSSQIG